MRYTVEENEDEHSYEFFSEGPKGRIKKVIRFEMIGENLFNLAFGDWNEEPGTVDDSSRTNNGDRNKVLATVAFTIINFTDHFPYAQILIVGSTKARTRLYQMGINDNLLRIKKDFDVNGFIDGNWEPFRPLRNYQSFLVRRK